jgi:hypothetical protein
MYGFLATTAGSFAIIVAVARVLQPEITAPLSFWLKVMAGVVAAYAFGYLVTPPGERWRRDP